MSESEFPRPVKSRHLPAEPLVLEASAPERAALAERFGIAAISSLRAEVALEADEATVIATGAFTADLMQSCAVSDEDFAVRIEEPIALRFARPAESAEEEIELDAEDCDEIEFTGETFDLGEAVAQSLGLAIDPYPAGPEADRARKQAGLLEEGARGALAEALAALKKT